MFSRGMDVVLEYRTVPVIIDDSLSKRTMKVIDSRIQAICESTRWTMVFKLRYIHKRFSLEVEVNDDSLSGNP